MFFFFYQGLRSQALAILEKAGGRDHLYSSLPLTTAQNHSDIYLQLCMWDDYHVFLLAPLETNKLAKWWVLPPHWITAWLIDYWMLICLLYALILHFGKGILKQESGGFELPKTITLVLQGKRLTKCASHPNISSMFNPNV